MMSPFEEELREIFDRYGAHLINIDAELYLEDKHGNLVSLPVTSILVKKSVDSINLSADLSKN